MVSEEKKLEEEETIQEAAESPGETQDDSPDAAEADVQKDESGSEEEPEKENPEEKRRFGKKKDKRIEKLEDQLADLEDKRVRQLAEFENFRKRSEKEKSQMFEIGAKTVIEKMLPVIDNFERGLMAVPEEDKDTSFVQGVELVYKQLLTAFEELGVKPIEAVGQEFDPNLHNAVMMVDDDSMESGTVAEEMQKGYLYRDTVVRHSMVKVVN